MHLESTCRYKDGQEYVSNCLYLCNPSLGLLKGVRGYFLLKQFDLKNQEIHGQVDGTDTEGFYASADSFASLVLNKGLNLSGYVYNGV